LVAQHGEVTGSANSRVDHNLIGEDRDAWVKRPSLMMSPEAAGVSPSSIRTCIRMSQHGFPFAMFDVAFANQLLT
jgi:hypothetical protein